MLGCGVSCVLAMAIPAVCAGSEPSTPPSGERLDVRSEKLQAAFTFGDDSAICERLAHGAMDWAVPGAAAGPCLAQGGTEMLGLDAKQLFKLVSRTFGRTARGGPEVFTTWKRPNGVVLDWQVRGIPDVGVLEFQAALKKRNLRGYLAIKGVDFIVQHAFWDRPDVTKGEYESLAVSYRSHRY